MDTKPFQIARQNSSSISSLSFDPDRAYFVTFDYDGTVRQWSTTDRVQNTPVWTMNLGRYTSVATLSPDGRWIVTSANGNKVTIWSTVTRECVIEVTGHTQAASSLDISMDSTRFASGSADKTVQIFDITSGTRLIQLPQEEGVTCVKFSQDASRIAVCKPCAYHRIGIYNTSSGENVFKIHVTSVHDRGIPLAWSSDDQQLFVACLGKITCVDTSTSYSTEWLMQGNGSQQASLVTSGKFIIYSVGSSVSFWDYTSRRQMGRIINHNSSVNCIAISHDGRRLACAHYEAITVHNLDGLIPEHLLPGILCLPLMRVGTTVLKSWVQGNPTETKAILLREITQHSSPTHHAPAILALVRTHIGEWRTALKDTEMSAQIRPSPIGQIARSIVHLAAGEQEIALDELDLVFRDCDQSDNKLLLVVNSILLFVCNKCKQAISRLRYSIDSCGSDRGMKDVYLQVLGMMYLKQQEYGNAIETLGGVEHPFTTEDRGLLMSLFIIFNWNFEDLKVIAWRRACERLYVSGSMPEVRDTLLKMIGTLPQEEVELTHGRILQDIINRSGEVTLLAWTGESSTHHSCLPDTPAVYSQMPVTPPSLAHKEEELRKRTAELRTGFPLLDALMAYTLVSRSQPVRFNHFHLHLPCIVFRLKTLRQEENAYRAETFGLGDVEFTTTDLLPLHEPYKLVLVNPWIHHFRESREARDEDNQESDVAFNVHSGNSVDAGNIDAGLVPELMIEEMPDFCQCNLAADVHARALQMVARLEQPFNALLLLRQSGGAYKRVAADHEIIIRGIEINFLRDICVEVLEVV